MKVSKVQGYDHILNKYNEGTLGVYKSELYQCITMHHEEFKRVATAIIDEIEQGYPTRESYEYGSDTAEESLQVLNLDVKRRVYPNDIQLRFIALHIDAPVEMTSTFIQLEEYDGPTVKAAERKPLRKFKFVASKEVEASDEEEARLKFANSSWDFAASAECYDITDEEESK